MSDPYFTGPVAPVVAVATVAALRAIHSNLFVDSQLARLLGVDFFEWDSSNIILDNGTTVLIPDDITHPAPGRWLAVVTAGNLTDIIIPDGTGLAFQVREAGDIPWIEVDTNGDDVLIGRDSGSSTVQFFVSNNSSAFRVRSNVGSGDWMHIAGNGSGLFEVGNGAALNPRVEFHIADGLDESFLVEQALNDYIDVDTRNGNERVVLGNSVTNPVFSMVGDGPLIMGVSGDNTFIQTHERSGDPGGVANYFHDYVKDVGAVSEKFLQDSGSNVLQLTSVGRLVTNLLHTVAASQTQTASTARSPTIIRVWGGVSTTDATPTTAATIGTTASRAMMLKAIVTWRSTSDGDSGALTLFRAAENTGGTLSLLGSLQLLGNEEDAGWGAVNGNAAIFVANGAAVEVEVEGQAGDNINWSVELEVVAHETS